MQLIDSFDALLAVGHSLVVVDHNPRLMRAADYIIDVGPGAGDRGGQVVAEGTPEDIASCSESVTGRYLQSAASRDDGRGVGERSGEPGWQRLTLGLTWSNVMAACAVVNVGCHRTVSLHDGVALRRISPATELDFSAL